MSEIKREPVKIIVGDVEYEAFDENHTLSDIARWASRNECDRDELMRIMGENAILTGSQQLV